MRRAFAGWLKAGVVATTLLCAQLAQASDWQYTVRPGDNIWALCKEYTLYDNCWRELPAYNGIDKPQTISVGQRLRFPAAWLKMAPVAATVLFVNGEVTTGSDSSRRPLQARQRLEIGARIVTGNGSATLQFVDGSLLTMSAFSEIVLDAVSAFKQSRSTSIQVSVPTGEVGIRVPLRQPRTRFDVRTPSAVAAVRGTRFRVNSSGEAGLTRSEVLEGQVGLSAMGASQLLDSGFGSLARRGEPPIDPVQLLDAPQWNLSCNDPGYAEWFAPPGASGYKLVLLEDDLQSDRILQTVNVIDTNYTFRNLETGCYQLRVNAVDTLGFNGLESQRQFCYDLQLAMPLLQELRWRNDRFAAQWTDVQYAEGYLLEIARDSEFKDIVATYSVEGSQLDTGLDALPGEVHVRVRAQARNGEVTSTYSEPLQIDHSRPRHWLVGIGAALLAFIAL